MPFWKRKKRGQSEIDALFGKLAAAAFPGGERQIALESDAVISLVDGKISPADAREVLIHAKGRALIAVQSATHGEEALRRCTESVRMRSRGKLSPAAAERVALYAFQRLIDQQDEMPVPAPSNPGQEMTQEEALKVARINAFRIARRWARTNADVRPAYNMDPKIVTLRYSLVLLTGDKNEKRKPIESDNDARERAVDVTTQLVLAHFAESGAAGSLPDPRKLESLTQEELQRTLELVRNEDSVRQYSDYDVSEARAAQEMHVPFDIVLSLGETGLLKDPPVSTDGRRKIMADILGSLGRE